MVVTWLICQCLDCPQACPPQVWGCFFKLDAPSEQSKLPLIPGKLLPLLIGRAWAYVGCIDLRLVNRISPIHSDLINMTGILRSLPSLSIKYLASCYTAIKITSSSSKKYPFSKKEQKEIGKGSSTSTYTRCVFQIFRSQEFYPQAMGQHLQHG
jgi:hypothetical protein